MAKQYTVSRSIDAPAQTVWDLLTDASTYADWNEAVISIEGPIAVGGTITLFSIVSPGRKFRLKVTAMEAPHRMVWADGMPLGLFKGERTYLLEEQDGTTEFSMTEEFSGPLSGMIAKAIPDMTESFNLFADGLKAAAERAGP